MKFSGIVALLPSVLLGSAQALTLRRSATGSPVERVVNLLEDLRDRLHTDEKDEQKLYDRFACWCEKTTSRKAAAINDATADLRSFGQTILSLKGGIATLSHEIEQLEANIRQNKDEVEQATAIRQKENAEFVADSAELKQAIAAMEKAVTVLVDGSSSLLQAAARAKVEAVVSALPTSKSLKTGQLELLSEYMRSGYAPQSMTVQGILKDMYETFAADLESSTQAEATANTNFENLVTVMTKEITQEEKQSAAKAAKKADSEQRLADTQAMYDDTQEQKKADISFFDQTKVACESKHDAWTLRSSLRSDEIAGIGQALQLLTSDSARELFASAIKAGKEVVAPALLQLSSPVARAYEALKASAGTGHSLRLAKLAAKVRTAKVGHFDEVLKAVDLMSQALRDEDAADIAKRDQCKEEYHKIESEVKDLSWKIKKNDAKIAKLAELIELRTAQLEKTMADIAEVNSNMAALTQERTAENDEFLKGKDEDQQAIDLLTTAKDAFAEFYKKNGIEMGPVQGSIKGAFVQQEPEFAVSADQAPDADFSHKGHHKHESKGVISMMTMIIEDLGDEIENSVKAEKVAQLDYQKQMSAARKLKDELVAKKVSLEGAIAKRSDDRSAELEDKDANERSLNGEVDYKKSITPDCDWILGAFEGRAKARASEMNGLTGAKEFLAGKQ